MNHRLRTVWVIARRDYAAIVFSRLFLLFLAVPAIATAMGLAFAAIGPHDEPPPPPARPLVVLGDAREMTALEGARARLAQAFGPDALPTIERGAGGEAERLLAERHAIAVLSAPSAAPRLRLAADAPPGLSDAIGRLIAEARHPVVLPAIAASTEPVRVATLGAASDARRSLGRSAQYAIFLFTIGLAGRLLANFIEERGNKVIELLVAAVPVDAIFYGKLLGMLMFSFTCIAAWLGGAAAATALAAPRLLHGLAAPAIGWPGFVALGAVHFALGYLLIGTVMLGLGAQTRTPADVQTLALPVTLAQLGLFALAGTAVDDPAGPFATIATALPWSTSLTAISRAATDAAWWPQLAAIAWQLLWLILSVRLASVRFRRAVLSSGPVRVGRG